MTDDQDWLLVIDMQNVFADPASPWFLPSFAATAARVEKLLPLFGSRARFTRFVPPRTITGSWVAYYQKWPFARDTHGHGLWSLVAPWSDFPAADSHQFSKWLPSLWSGAEKPSVVTLCGVSTDCCVLATALAAVDAGVLVRVVADACGAKSPAIHETALRILRARAPMLELTTLEAERVRRRGGSGNADPGDEATHLGVELFGLP
jgi:nicotinamidase-related amidase